MAPRPPQQRGAPAWGATLRTQIEAELDRSRRLRWGAVGVAAIVVGVLVWALVAAPLGGATPLVVVAVVLTVVSVLYLVEVVMAVRRARRFAHLAASEEQQRRSLAADVEQLEAVDVAARRLAAVTTLPEAIECLLASARGLVPAVSGAVLLAAADDLRVAMMGRHASDEAAAVSTGGQELADRALARGAALRGGHDTALEEHGAPSRLAVPLRAGEEVVGVLVLERATDSDAFSPADQRALERLAPHAALALERTGHLVDRPAGNAASASPTGPVAEAASQSVPAAGGPAVGVPRADVSEVVREVLAAASGGRRAARRIAVLASTPAPTSVDPDVLRRAWEALVGSLDRSLPPDGALAVEVLPVGPDWEVAVVHGGEVLPEDVLEEPPPGAPYDPSVRELVERFGGAVTARARSGMAQVRLRVPGIGDLEAAQPTERRSPTTVS